MKQFYLTAWCDVCRLKCVRGLGLRRMQHMNVALTISARNQFLSPQKKKKKTLTLITNIYIIYFYNKAKLLMWPSS